MSTVAYLLTVGTSAAEIVTSNVHSATNVVLQNIGSINIYLGDSAVTTSSYGLCLIPGMGISITLGSYDGLSAIAGSSGGSLSVLGVKG